MVLVGCKPKARHTEQHDIFFGIGYAIKELVPEIIHSWPEAEGDIHIDAWREVNCVDQQAVEIFPKQLLSNPEVQRKKLFFINLGGYKQTNLNSITIKCW